MTDARIDNGRNQERSSGDLWQGEAKLKYVKGAQNHTADTSSDRKYRQIEKRLARARQHANAPLSVQRRVRPS
jgi:hypothetical protein